MRHVNKRLRSCWICLARQLNDLSALRKKTVTTKEVRKVARGAVIDRRLSPQYRNGIIQMDEGVSVSHGKTRIVFLSESVLMEHAFEQLVALCYECLLDESAWLPMLAQLMKLSGRQQGVLLAWDQRSAGAQVSSTSICDESAIALYNACYNAIDPGKQFMAEREAGHWYHDAEELGERRIARDPYYQEFYRPQGMHSTSCLKLYEHQHTGAYLSLFTNRDAGPPRREHQQLLERVTPHLRRASRILEKLNDLQLGLHQRDLLLDTPHSALWIVNGKGRCLYRNALAEQKMTSALFPVLERNGLLLFRGGGGVGLSAIEKATSVQGAQASYLPMGSEGHLLVLPLASRLDAVRACTEPVALLILARPGQGNISATAARLFHLTPAESRLAELLLQGRVAKQCAQELDVSIATIRTQLRSLLRKTNTQRQVELLGLLQGLGRF